ncbi:MAG: GumC family protein [Thainema sp.]
MQSNTLNPAVNPALEPETEFGYGQLFGIIWRRRWWFLGVFSSAISVATVVALNEKPTYQSSMQLLVEPNFQESLSQSDLDGRPTISSVDSNQSEIDYATQLNLLRSKELLQETVNRLQDKYPELSVEVLDQYLKLVRIAEEKTATRIFEAVYFDTESARAQDVLKTLQEVYLEYNLERQELRLTQGLTFINQQLDSARRNLQSSQGSLEQFRANQNIINPEQQGIETSSLLNQMQQQRQIADAEYQQAQALFNSLQQQLGLSPQQALIQAKLSQSSRFQSLLNELQATELQLAQQRTIFTDLDPSVQVLIDQRLNQLSLLRQEVGYVLGDAPIAGRTTDENLLTVGQLSDVDLSLVIKMAEVQSSLESLNIRRKNLAQAEQELRANLSRFPELIAEYDRIQPDIEIERAVLQQLLLDREQISAELAQGGYNWQIVESPTVEELSPSPVKTLALGGVVGLFLGGVAAFLREAVDGVVHTSDDLQKQVALPFLGMLPDTAPSVLSAAITAESSNSQLSSLPTVQIIQSIPFREAFDLIYKNIQFVQASSQLRSLAITSALASEGKSTLTLGLALTAARLGKRVLVIDGDLRRPTLHEKLGLLWDAQGLSTFLSGKSTAVSPYQLSWLNSNIEVLPAGLEPSDPVSLLSSQRMQELIASYENTHDLVLVDTSPVLGKADALQIASYCSGVLLVAQLDRVTQTELNQAASMLSQLNVLGMVANGAKTRPAERYGGYVEASS